MAAPAAYTALLQSILEDTVEFYATDPTCSGATPEGTCEYRAVTGERCAVGRYFTDEWLDFMVDNPTQTGGAIEEVIADYEERFPEVSIGWESPKLAHVSVDFWAELQLFHDNQDHFSYKPHGLTEDGWMFIGKIARRFKLDTAKLVKFKLDTGWHD